MNQAKLLINPCFSVIRKHDKEIVFALHGKINRLKCPVALTDHILANTHGRLTPDELMRKVSEAFPKAAVQKLMNLMIRSGILVKGSDGEADKEQGSPETVAKVGIFGNGKLAAAVTLRISCLKTVRIDEEGRGPGIADRPEKPADLNQWTDRFTAILASRDLVVLAVCPEHVDQLRMSALNRACIRLNLPFVLGFFNGRELVLGPTVIPHKTPCLDCLAAHRLWLLAPSLGIGRPQFGKSVENHPFPDHVAWHSSLHWTGWLMAEEVQRLAQERSAPLYMKRQIRIPREAVPDLPEILFEPVSTCPGCRGMNLGYTIERPKDSHPEGVKISMKSATARHTDNGFRSMSAEEARTLLDRALGRLGMSMQIRRCRGGVLDGIIPSYRSRVDTLYARDLPFAVHERHHWGKGMSEKQAYLSGGFELVERICAEYTGGMEMVQCPWRKVKDRAMDLRTRVGHQAYLRNVERVDADLTVDWVWGWSPSRGKALLVPASMVFLSRSVFQGKFMLNFSSGLAAGTTMEDAVLQGLMETVEHDARYIWQANAVVTPRLTGFPDAVREIEDKLAERGFDLIVKDYTTDIGIYVFRAWIVKPDDPVRYAASGMGAGLRPEMALHRAVSEAKQAWPSHARSSAPHHASRSNTDLFGYNTAALFTHYQDNRMDILGRGPERDYGNLPDLSSGNIAFDIQKAMDLIAGAVPDSDILVVNLTRESFGIPVVRVIASGLQNPSQPLQNFPGGRLFSVPVTLGRRSRRLSYEELYNDRHQQ